MKSNATSTTATAVTNESTSRPRWLRRMVIDIIPAQS
jgi:hypothetical protein